MGQTFEEKDILSSLLLTLDQTLTNFAPGTNKAMAFNGSTGVNIFRSTSKLKQHLGQSIQE